MSLQAPKELVDKEEHLALSAIQNAAEYKARVKAVYVNLPELTTSGPESDEGSEDTTSPAASDGNASATDMIEPIDPNNTASADRFKAHAAAVARGNRNKVHDSYEKADDGDHLDLCNGVNETALCYCDRLGDQGCHKTLFEGYVRGQRSVIVALRALLGPAASNASAAVTMCQGLGPSLCHEQISDAVKNGTCNASSLLFCYGSAILFCFVPFCFIFCLLLFAVVCCCLLLFAVVCCCCCVCTHKH